jgi:voltage-gated potassium channel
MKRQTPLKRAMDRFAADPASVKNAVLVMIIITLGIVFVGGVIVWVFDKQDFPDLGSALWFTLQTVTTVGYGDHVPSTEVGRLTGAAVMVVGVALIAILTASITSVFVAAAQRRQGAGREVESRDSSEAMNRRLDEVLARLSAIESALAAHDPGSAAAASKDKEPEITA